MKANVCSVQRATEEKKRKTEKTEWENEKNRGFGISNENKVGIEVYGGKDWIEVGLIKGWDDMTYGKIYGYI